MVFNLTDEDYVLVGAQCQIQGALDHWRDFALAYDFVKHELTEDALFQEFGVTMCVLAAWVNNKEGKFRQIPALLPNGNSGINWQLIPQAMENLEEAIRLKNISPLEAYREFELIHPFEDGNGRLGHLLWAWLTRHDTGVWPNTLPPDIFSAVLG